MLLKNTKIGAERVRSNDLMKSLPPMVSMQYYYYHSAMVLFFNCCTDADVAHAFTILAATDSKMKRASAQFIGPRHHQRSELSRMHQHAEKRAPMTMDAIEFPPFESNMRFTLYNKVQVKQ